MKEVIEEMIDIYYTTQNQFKFARAVLVNADIDLRKLQREERTTVVNNLKILHRTLLDYVDWKIGPYSEEMKDAAKIYKKFKHNK